METQMEIQQYLEQGRTALAQGQAREAAIAYAHGALLEPDNPVVQLGLAEANLALGNYATVQVASRKVLELQSVDGIEAKIAQALLDLLDHCYGRALQNVDATILQDPSIAYVHALRSYLLRATGQNYDATLARNTAMRRGGRFENCFPLIEPEPAVLGAQRTEVRSLSSVQPDQPLTGNQMRSEHFVVPNWSRPNTLRRRSLRVRFFLNQNPGFMTNVLLAAMVVCYLLGTDIAPWMSVTYPLAHPWEIWRYVTTVFIYPQGQSNLLGFLISLLSFFFVGRTVENFYGPIRFLAIFLVSGILCNIAYIILVLGNLDALAAAFVLALGPVSAIMGIFGAIGVFYIVNRQSLGVSGNSALVSWGFWLLLNLIMVGSIGLAAVLAELSCVIVGMILAYLLILRVNSGRGRL